MKYRKPLNPEKYADQNSNKLQLPVKKKSAILGALLLVVGCCWIFWLVIGSHTTSSGSFVWNPIGTNATSAITPVPQLAADGVSISQANNNPTISQQQAMLIANQLEPIAAANAKTANSSYVLLNYAGSSTHSSINNVPVWMILYQQVTSGANNRFVDPNAPTTSYHNLYVFVDATSGKELLSVWL